MTIAIRPARMDDVAALDQVLADGFFGDPLNDWLLPDEASRGAALRRGMGYVLRQDYLPHGGAWTTEELDGVALWGKPDGPKPSARLGFDVDEQYDIGLVHVWAMLHQPARR